MRSGKSNRTLQLPEATANVPLCHTQTPPAAGKSNRTLQLPEATANVPLCGTQSSFSAQKRRHAFAGFRRNDLLDKRLTLHLQPCRDSGDVGNQQTLGG